MLVEVLERINYKTFLMYNYYELKEKNVTVFHISILKNEFVQCFFIFLVIKKYIGLYF